MVTIRDLKEFVPGHPPSPYAPAPTISRGGRSGRGFLPSGLRLLAVGWLGKEVTCSGAVPDAVIEKLLDANDAGQFFFDEDLGVWICLMCTNETPGCYDVLWKDRDTAVGGTGHYLVRHGDVVYVCPVLITHYVLDHQYRPPQEFIDAVLQGRILGAEDLEFRAE